MARRKRAVEPLPTIWNCPDELWDNIVVPTLHELDPEPHTGRPRIDQRKALDGIAHHSLLLARCRSLEVAVVAGPADAGQQTHSLDARHALRPGRRQRRDGRVDDLAPDPSLGWRLSLMVRKAC